MDSETMLTPRQREILSILVREYVTSANPVGSKTLREVGGLQVSPATIRNEMAVLEEYGYIEQPHTSAGRIPTAKGYRLFVEQLMEDTDLPAQEKRMIQHQFHQLRLDLDQWLELTAAILAHTVRAASLVTAPRAPSSRYRHVELISVSDRAVLLVLVLQDGSIHQDMLITEGFVSQAELSRVSNKLNDLAHDLSGPEIATLEASSVEQLSTMERSVLECILEVMQQQDAHTFSRVYSDGLINVLEQPEFVDADKARRIIEVIESQTLLDAVLSSILRANGVQVIIGGEGAYGEIDDVSMVFAPYGVRGLASGVLGVVGPVRLPYARAISAVRYVAQVMDDMLAGLFGQSDVGTA